MKIVAWKLIAFDENENEITVDVHSNDVASLIDDFITEEFEESEDEWRTSSNKAQDIQIH